MNYFFFNEVLKHGINNPINSILLSSELAIENFEKNPKESLKLLKQIKITSEYVRALLRRDASKENQKNYFYLEQAIREILVINSSYKKNIIYSLQHKTPENLQLKGNKILFQEMLICLINNAIESYQDKTNRTILLTSSIQDKKLVLSITDGGTGMNWLERNIAFTKNFSLKDDHSGHGLYIVKRIVEKEFKGEIDIISQKKRGTTVRCFFPLT